MSLVHAVRNAVRRAVGLPQVSNRRLPEKQTELQKRMQPFRHAPQWFRLLMLHRITKRYYAKRRMGMSAKSPEVAAHHRRLREDKLPCSHQRLAPATGANSYDAWKLELATKRAADREATRLMREAL